MFNTKDLYVIAGKAQVRTSDIELYESEEEANEALIDAFKDGIEYRDTYSIISFEDYLSRIWDDGYDNGSYDTEVTLDFVPDGLQLGDYK